MSDWTGQEGRSYDPVAYQRAIMGQRAPQRRPPTARQIWRVADQLADIMDAFPNAFDDEARDMVGRLRHLLDELAEAR